MTFTTESTLPYQLRRLGVLMAPRPGDPLEAEGVLNPASAWTPEGELMLFPRMVAAGNYSRIGRARVLLDGGVPTGVEREGVALEPERPWERGARHGGTEDARITRVPALGLHLMTYVAFGPSGPRPALAVSEDLLSWRRLGPLSFGYDDALGVDLDLIPNKDVVFFPEPVMDPSGVPSLALLHRPMWERFGAPDEAVLPPAVAPDGRASIWISYVPLADVERDLSLLGRPIGHRFLAGPAFDWEALKVGAGPAPLRTPEGWLVLHHGVTGTISGGSFRPQKDVRYSAGALLLDLADPSRVVGRTRRPLLEPETAAETQGVVSNVVFPTAIERIDGVHYVFYGMADDKIGVARLERTDGMEW